jgi:hypothetical protein
VGSFPVEDENVTVPHIEEEWITSHEPLERGKLVDLGGTVIQANEHDRSDSRWEPVDEVFGW